MHRPLIIAHRALTPGAIENSPSALRQLSGSGADLAELDVRLSLDRKPVVIHDAFLHRVSRGRGWVRLWPSWLLEKLGLRSEDPEDHITNLRTMLKLIPNGIQPALHLKDRSTLKATLRLIEHPESTWLWLERPSDVHQAVAAKPGINCTLLRPGAWIPLRRDAYIRDASQSGAKSISFPWDKIDEEMIEQVHQAGLMLFTREHEPERIAYLVSIGIDGIVTDDPASTLERVCTALNSLS